MKILYQYTLLLIVSALVFSCKKDNFNPPGSVLSGHLMYSGDTIFVEAGQVPFQLYESGFGKVAQVGSSSPNTTSGSGSPVGSAVTTFAQDGSYSAVLFDGNYKLIVPNGQGPFLWKQTSAGTPDSIAVTLKGSQNLDLEVTPFYMIRNSQITASGGNVTASFKAEKVIKDANAKDIERVSLYINKTELVSGASNNNIALVDLAGSDITNPNSIQLSVAIPSMTPTQNYVFARVGLKIANVEDMIFSPLVKVSF